jgi:hypothetical protein
MNEKPTRRSGGSRLKEGVVKEKQAFWKLGLSGGGNVPGERYSLISVAPSVKSTPRHLRPVQRSSPIG